MQRFTVMWWYFHERIVRDWVGRHRDYADLV